MPEDELTFDLTFKDMPLSVRIGVPVSVILGIVALVLSRLF